MSPWRWWRFGCSPLERTGERLADSARFLLLCVADVLLELVEVDIQSVFCSQGIAAAQTKDVCLNSVL